MKQAHVAAIVEDPFSKESARRLQHILDSLGISWQSYPSTTHFLQSGQIHEPVAILAPLTLVAELMEDKMQALAVHSLFFYGGASSTYSVELRILTGCEGTLDPLEHQSIAAVVSKEWPSLTGPMHAIRATSHVQSGDRVANLKSKSPILSIIDTDRGLVFFSCESSGSRVFVSCSGHIPDLNARVEAKNYDVREQFLSAVPLLMYLKWAFRDHCWQANELGACWIVDDPLLRTRYGYCDFHLLEAQMKQHSFTTNIAMIPWNSRRTSRAMASLVRESEGRFSVSVHGCNHTAHEFGTENEDALCMMTNVAIRRMDQHQQKTGVQHDAIMVFPQGDFSRKSLEFLQKFQFMAAVNTDVLPMRLEDRALTVADTWRPAITSYASFPLFTRRYPSDGLENFAFDLLLGKPCLLVEHHTFFKGQHAEVVRFVDSLNSLNAPLRWRGLGDLLRRVFESQTDNVGLVHVRMFANELLLKNTASTKREYRISKANTESAGVTEVLLDGEPATWRKDDDTIIVFCSIPAGSEVSIRIRYRGVESNPNRNYSLRDAVQVAGRRYLSELRDNWLCDHQRLLALAEKAKHLVNS